MQKCEDMRYVIKCPDGTFYNPHGFPEERCRVTSIQEATKFYSESFAREYIGSAPKGSTIHCVIISYKVFW